MIGKASNTVLTYATALKCYFGSLHGEFPSTQYICKQDLDGQHHVQRTSM